MQVSFRNLHFFLHISDIFCTFVLEFVKWGIVSPLVSKLS